MGEIKKAKDRLEVLEKIKQFEKEKLFDLDVENDPPGKILEPKDVDYLNKKLSSKIKTKIANYGGKKLFDGWLKNKKVIFGGVDGIENLKNFSGGAIVTCNHFNAFDNYAVYLALKKYFKKFTLYKVIREGNYSLPGKLGFFMRHGNTLPLSENKQTMLNCLKAIDTLLKQNKLILIYPEQGMWWNYRKPRPFKIGAFRFAYRSNVPIIPCFITLKDSNIIGDDGFFVQEYFVHIMPLIFPNKNMTEKESSNKMRDENFELCKNMYEKIYNQKLVYES